MINDNYQQQSGFVRTITACNQKHEQLLVMELKTVSCGLLLYCAATRWRANKLTGC